MAGEGFAAAVASDPVLAGRVADVVELLDRVRDLRVEIDRLAPNGTTPSLFELQSLLGTARRVADYPMVDRCGCGWTSGEPVEYHQRGGPECRAHAPREHRVRRLAGGDL